MKTNCTLIVSMKTKRIVRILPDAVTDTSIIGMYAYQFMDDEVPVVVMRAFEYKSGKIKSAVADIEDNKTVTFKPEFFKV